MPSKLERKLSKKVSRKSINPSHTPSSDSDSLGAVEADFFDAPPDSQGDHDHRDRSRSISPDVRHPSKNRRQSQQGAGRMSRHPTQQNLPQAGLAASGLSTSRFIPEPVTPETLVKGSVLRLCQYLGDINHMPANLDINNRSRLMDLIDSARRQGRLPWQPGEKHLVHMSLSAKDIKVSEARGEAVLFRLHLHLLAAMSYFNDDQQHLVIMKSADEQSSKCVLRVFHCKSRDEAEDLCTIVDTAFDLLYTDATMAHLDLSITNDRRQPYPADTTQLSQDGAPQLQQGKKGSSQPPDQIDGQRPSVKAARQKSAALANEAVSHVGEKQYASAAPTHPPPPPAVPQLGNAPPMPPPPPAAPAPPNQVPYPPQATKSALEMAGTVAVYSDDEDSQGDEEKNEEELSQEAAAVVKQYMETLHKILLPDQMKQFASLIREYRINLPVSDFCSRLKSLFGQDKKFMLPGMRSFIPADDQFYFENFLQEENVTELKIPSGVAGKS